MKTENVWEHFGEKDVKNAEVFAKEYIDFLNNGKTERECVDEIVNILEENGFKELQSLIEKGAKLKAGDKVYAVRMNKSVIAFVIGKDDIEKGMNILGAHIDSPRLDVKQNPLYEEGEISYLDTHYYGGIKKYQWVTIPLALHGVIVKKDGTTVEVNIGEDEDDPVFFVSDLLIHLAADQMEKKAAKVIEGEALDIVVGNRPLVIKADKEEGKKTESEDDDSKKKDKGSKDYFLKLLKDTYDVEEADFLSAELEVVPAGKARFAGLDKSLVLGYGHDDRVCAYPSLRAFLEVKKPKRTSCCILVDKEEIGSVGATGMRSHFFEDTVAELIGLLGDYSELKLRRAMTNSCMLSSDVNAAFDPSYADKFEKKNASYLAHGLVLCKFTGARGKSGSNDSNAEYIAMIRKIFEEDSICFQTAELGKVDIGGGGTIAYITALYGMCVIDAGVAVLNMHAPWEAISVADLYEAKRAYVTFLSKAGM